MTLKYNQCACARLVADTYIHFHFYFYSDTYRSHFLNIVGDCLLPGGGRGECNILNLISSSSNIHQELALARFRSIFLESLVLSLQINSHFKFQG